MGCLIGVTPAPFFVVGVAAWDAVGATAAVAKAVADVVFDTDAAGRGLAALLNEWGLAPGPAFAGPAAAALADESGWDDAGSALATPVAAADPRPKSPAAATPTQSFLLNALTWTPRLD
jgi:hypothetical protein